MLAEGTTDLLEVAEHDFEARERDVADELAAMGRVTDSTRTRYGRAWEWLCARLCDDVRSDEELPSECLRRLRRLLRA